VVWTGIEKLETGDKLYGNDGSFIHAAASGTSDEAVNIV
jgi:hypothetical protein